MTRPEPTRVEELASGLRSAQERLRAACVAADRPADDVDLLVVTKFFPASDVLALVDLGCRSFGESREPEAGRKASEVRSEVTDPLAFHMIGQIQTKKAKTVGRWADRVHSMDTVRLADALDDAATKALDSGERSTPLDVLVQINLDGAPDRGGVGVDDLEAMAAHVDDLSALRLRGLMVIAPQEGTAEQWMARAAEIRASFLVGHPDAVDFSAGMSGDLEEAVTHGSTCVRVGTAIMGSRPIVSP
ncbi:YggS family pyridoxal phosphate-dependent enzyme [Williamsia phyllosphaerae]|uniref:Pyridoxal phosphate homeostasis protein n=1 Tax=Williamsia phyllosphaerae TaxID=885042 RepID=A0ABQ1UXG8_9NOCA|nr:YggS family pyridoxal phosphate-dependent enzyme [Williamsia phyllosphaerae]GGF29567.1 YggS family pyridoxal phosphate enzyme [Williamsia phyllosphaerae]